MKFRRGLNLAFKHFCSSTSLSSYHFLLDGSKYKQRCFWSIVQILTIITTTVFICTLWTVFTRNIVYTTLEHSYYPVTKVPFPGVAICNLNKISKSRVLHVVDYLSKFTHEKPEDILDLMKLLGSLYDFDSRDKFENIEHLENILNAVNRNDFKIPNILKYLSTPCEEFLQKCQWQGETVNCSKIFSMALIYEGYCCLFNYVNDYNTEKDNKKVLFSEPSFQKGLKVTININESDYFYTSLASVGVKVAVFIPTDYPDVISGSLIESLFETATEGFMELIPTTFYSTGNVIRYPVGSRQCLFDSEQQTFFGFYSQSDCLVACRVQSMKALCNCVPFMIPKQKDQDFICTLADVKCLERFKSNEHVSNLGAIIEIGRSQGFRSKDKWISLKPYDDAGIDPALFSLELQNSLQCDQPCYPKCESTMYRVDSHSAARRHQKGELKNTTNIHIFYSNRFYNLFKQDVLFYWFEILSNFGGTFAFFIGISAISVVEMLYFFIYKSVVFAMAREN